MPTNMAMILSSPPRIVCCLLLLWLPITEGFLVSRPLARARRIRPQDIAVDRPTAKAAPPAAAPSPLGRLLRISSNGAEDGHVNMVLVLVGSTTSALVSVTFFGVLAWKRDALMVAFFIGSILNGVLSKVLKKLIGESRPPAPPATAVTGRGTPLPPSDGGMPSSHAMSLGFIGTFAAPHLPGWARLPLAVYVAASLYYRVAVRLHTAAQVGVGLALGAAHGALWYHLCRGTLGVSATDLVARHLLNEEGLLPLPALVIPVIVGAAVVGSFERRISHWIATAREKRM